MAETRRHAIRAIAGASLSLLLAQGGFAADQTDSAPWRIAPTPEWVEPLEPFSESGVEDDTPRGIDRRLYSLQYDGRHVGRGVMWHAHEFEFLTRRGVENASGISIDFDPTYQRLALHEVSVRRDGHVVDKLPTVRADLLRREPDLDALIYDGTHTLNLVLEDVRVGDVLRYTYSIAGENPVLGGRREIVISADRGKYPSGRRRTRLLTTVERPFHVRTRGTDVVPVTVRRGDTLETIVDQADPPERIEEEDVPDRTKGWARIAFSDLHDWGAVVDWAAPLYRLAEPTPTELVQVAAAIRAAHPDDEAARIGTALHWVQDEIRYFGIELGRDSHLPARPAETLSRRFGDCKGKSLLLIALLAELGVAAEPALVDTSREIADPDFPWRLHAFDHVIVHVATAGRSHWLDPTRAWQRGALGDFHEPDYARALVLADGETGLRDMTNPASGSRLVIDKRLELPADRTTEASLEVRTVRERWLAESLREDIEMDGLAALGEHYVDYYRDMFPGLRSIALPDVDELRPGGARVTERYAIADFWLEESDVERFRWLWADELVGWLDEPPDAAERVQPYAPTHPLEIDETWRVSLPERLWTDGLDATLVTPWFTFEKSHTLDSSGTELVVTMRYRSLADEVAVDDLARYSEALETLEDKANFYVEDSPPAASLGRHARAGSMADILGRLWSTVERAVREREGADLMASGPGRVP